MGPSLFVRRLSLEGNILDESILEGKTSHRGMMELSLGHSAWRTTRSYFSLVQGRCWLGRSRGYLLRWSRSTNTQFGFQCSRLSALLSPFRGNATLWNSETLETRSL